VSELVAILGVLVNTAILVVYALTLRSLKRQAQTAENVARQSLSASFLQLFPVIERHHSREVAEFRRVARNDLGQQCEAARIAGKCLRDHNPAAAETASDVVNYYESIGMLIEHGGNLLPGVVNMLLDMVQVSAHDVWEILYSNIDVIHPEKLGSWAGNFENLYFRIAEHAPTLKATVGRLQRDAADSEVPPPTRENAMPA
jgi:hypothetical protein